jgi:F-type H+-transporting ATPase subunit delta
MGAQTRQSLDLARTLLAGKTAGGRELAAHVFAAAVGLSSSPALRQALCDSASEVKTRQALATKAFASLSTDAKKLVGELVAMRWSRPEDLQAGLEDLGIRLCAATAAPSTDVVGELLAVSELIHSDPELELAMGSKRVPYQHKNTLLARLLGKKVSAETLAIVQHLVSDPRGRRIGAMLARAADTVADHHGRGLAVVTVAKDLSAQQRTSIEKLLHAHYGKDHYVAQVTNPELIGGLKIRVGDDVIDGSIATRLQDVRTQLAG